jgi:hypothetical protein
MWTVFRQETLVDEHVHWVVMSGFHSEQEAQVECDRFNDLNTFVEDFYYVKREPLWVLNRMPMSS